MFADLLGRGIILMAQFFEPDLFDAQLARGLGQRVSKSSTATRLDKPWMVQTK